MREILFRGKRIDFSDTWVYGQYCISPLTDENSGTEPKAGWFFLSDNITRHLIIQNNVSFWVDEKTIGQYIGMKDIEGNKIFEWDLCSLYTDRIGLIQFSHGVFGINFNYKENLDPDYVKGMMYGSWGQNHNLRKLDDLGQWKNDGVDSKLKIKGNYFDGIKKV